MEWHREGKRLRNRTGEKKKDRINRERERERERGGMEFLKKETDTSTQEYVYNPPISQHAMLPIQNHSMFWKLRLSFLVKTEKISDIVAKFARGSTRSVVPNELDCDIVVSEVEFQSHYHVQFKIDTVEKAMNFLTLLQLRLNSTTTVLLRGWPWH